MEETLVAFSIQLRKDTSANWGSVNPVLLIGEPGFETDTNKLKIGDGESAWNVLPYIVPEIVAPTATPSGIVSPFAGATAPTGWLMCNGSAVSRTTYADLFTTIGTTFGSGDGSTTFNLPNLNGRVPVGFNVTQADFDFVGKSGGSTTHTLTTNEMPSHTHIQNSHSHTGSSNSAGFHNHSASTESAGSHSHTASTNTAGGHTHGGTNSGGSHTHSYNVGTTAATVTSVSGSGVSSVGLAQRQTSSITSAQTTGSAGSHTHTIDSAGSHSHTVTIDDGGSHSHTVTVDSNGDHSHTITVGSTTAVNQNAGGGLAHNNLQPYIVLNYIIKT